MTVFILASVVLACVLILSIVQSIVQPLYFGAMEIAEEGYIAQVAEVGAEGDG